MMKLSLAIIFSILLATSFGFHTSPDTKYDWENHEDGNDLEISLTNEPGVIFVVFFSKTIEGNDDLNKANDVVRNRLKNDLAKHNEVTYTEVDLTEPTDQEDERATARFDTYKNLAKDMKLNTNLLEQGPIVAVTNRGEGSWIHGKGKALEESDQWTPGQDVYEEVLDSIELFIKESKDRKEGGTGVLPGSNRVKRRREISLPRRSH